MTAFVGLIGAARGPLDAAEIVRGLPFAEWAPAERPYVVVNMVATVDGRAAVRGRAGPIGNASDRELFHALRARGDAVMVGAGTARIERYGRLVRDDRLQALREELGSRRSPLAVIVSDSLRFQHDLPLLGEEATDVAFITGARHELDFAPRARVRYVREPLWAALRSLRAQQGIRAIVCEGGPGLYASLLAAGLVDELFLCVAPSLAAGPDPLTILTGPLLDPPLELTLAGLLESEGHLFARYKVAVPPAGFEPALPP